MVAFSSGTTEDLVVVAETEAAPTLPFSERYQRALADPELAAKLTRFQRSWRQSRAAALSESEFVVLRERMKRAKSRVTDDLDRYLDMFETAATQAGALVPLAHPIALSFIDVRLWVEEDEGEVHLEAEARCVGRTGVEIEAMAAASIAALTVYDMVKALEREVEITAVRLLHKSGGKSGEWNRDGEEPAAGG